MRFLVTLTLVLTTLPISSAPAFNISLAPIGTYESGIFDESAAEIPAFDPTTNRLFVVNAGQGVDVLDLTNPKNPSLLFQIPAVGTNSVAVNNGTLAVAIENADKQMDGTVAFFNTNLASTDSARSIVTVGALPDMLTFTPNGQTVLVANEGEPNDNYDVDPEGSVSIIDVSGGIDTLIQSNVTTAGFSSPGLTIDGTVRLGPSPNAAQNLEPEYIAVAPDGSQAFVSLQENNALGILDLTTNQFTSVKSLGFKDHSQAGNGLDANTNDKAPLIETLPFFGMYQPDAIAAYESNGQTYIVTANEGDGREYEGTPGFIDEVDLADLNLDTTAFSEDFRNRVSAVDSEGEPTDLGNFTVTNTLGDTDGDGDFDEIYSFGARSFSIFDDSGTLVFDSGDQFEQIIKNLPDVTFNASNSNNKIDNRSDNKGPEPEAITLGELDGSTYAFIGLERVGGVMIYDLTDPNAPTFVDYINNRDFSENVSLEIIDPADPTMTDMIEVPNPAAGDLGPEGIIFIDAADSPNGIPLVVVANEVSGTTTIFAVVPEPTSICLVLSGLAMYAARRR